MATFRLKFEARMNYVLAAAPVLLALRKPKTPGLPRVGAPIELHIPGSRVGQAVCHYRGLLIFNADGVVRALTPYFADGGDRTFRLLDQAEQARPQAAEHAAKLAACLGYESWADLWRWHLEQGAPDENGVVTREVIGFAVAPAVATAVA